MDPGTGKAINMFLYDPSISLIGFDGSPLGEGGRARAIVRNNVTNQYFKLRGSLTPEAGDVLFTWAQIEAFADENRITLLPNPVSAFPHAVAVYVKQTLLDGTAEPTPWQWKEHMYGWQQLTDECWVGFLPQQESIRLLDHWAGLLAERARKELVSFFASQDAQNCATAEELATMARGIVHDRTLRSRILIRLGVALMFSATPERLHSLFNLSVRPHFNTITWAGFQEQVRHLGETLVSQAMIEESAEYTSDESETNKEEKELLRELAQRSFKTQTLSLDRDTYLLFDQDAALKKHGLLIQPENDAKPKLLIRPLLAAADRGVQFSSTTQLFVRDIRAVKSRGEQQAQQTQFKNALFAAKTSREGGTPTF